MSAVTTLDAGLARAFSENGATDASARLRAMLLDRLDALGHAPGTARARSAVDFATHLSGSPGESASRVQMHVLRFPKPELQFPVVDRNGTLWHADFGWPTYRQLGEFDGFTKYTRAVYTHARPIEEIVWAEKKREDLMRAATGFGMARWLWSDAIRGPRLRGILSEAGIPCG